VAIVPWVRPAPTPTQPKIFAKPAQLLPKPQRYLIATVAMDVDVKGLTYQVCRSLRTGAPRPDQSRLFRART